MLSMHLKQWGYVKINGHAACSTNYMVCHCSIHHNPKTPTHTGIKREIGAEKDHFLLLLCGQDTNYI